MKTKAEIRESLTAAILSDAALVVRQELADSPTSLSVADRQFIESEVIDNAKLILDSLSSAEMANQGALILHLASARMEAQRLIRDHRFTAENTNAR